MKAFTSLRRARRLVAFCSRGALVAVIVGAALPAAALTPTPASELKDAATRTLSQRGFVFTNVPDGVKGVYQAPDLVRYDAPSEPGRGVSLVVGRCTLVETSPESNEFFTAAIRRTFERKTLRFLRVLQGATDVSAEAAEPSGTAYDFRLPDRPTVAFLRLRRGTVTVEDGLIQRVVLEGKDTTSTNPRESGILLMKYQLSDFGTAPVLDVPTPDQIVAAPDDPELYLQRELEGRRVGLDECRAGE